MTGIRRRLGASQTEINDSTRHFEHEAAKLDVVDEMETQNVDSEDVKHF